MPLRTGGVAAIDATYMMEVSSLLMSAQNVNALIDFKPAVSTQHRLSVIQSLIFERTHRVSKLYVCSRLFSHHAAKLCKKSRFCNTPTLLFQKEHGASQ